ncbi:MAG: capsular biosynthesis protein CpsI [Acidiferrobacteraceae bacterium]|nr:capsular biosynthesis protein CpsI [Acidiferrobacteraceae bacterium]|tara:strand:+ start:5325 stop:6341 length:1017 start_codon:yes stop_codon:yes gene_type:complete
MKILVTGAAGFIGSSLTNHLLSRGDTVVGADNLNDYYDVRLKEARLNIFNEKPNFQFVKIDISDRRELSRIFSNQSFDGVVNLAAQAGVRYSIENPYVYVDSNLVGFVNILEECRQNKIDHLVYASTSSVYGSNAQLPSAEHDNTDRPMSLYAATKKANEVMAYAYSHLYRLPTTGLRFFTVYGPWGRPDMALFKFTKSILADEPIPVYNKGEMVRDFTYIDDIVSGVILALDNPPIGEPKNKTEESDVEVREIDPWKIYNIGNSQRVQLMDYVEVLEKELGKKASLELLPMQDGDIPATEADIKNISDDLGYYPKTDINEGVARFVSWYRSYYSISS